MGYYSVDSITLIYNDVKGRDNVNMVMNLWSSLKVRNFLRIVTIL
jgi:hypothetical protein